MSLPPTPNGENCKKRPLSIASTSSSGSYCSNSLFRHSKKKIAQGNLESKKKPTYSHDNLNSSLDQKCRLSVSSSDPTLSKVSTPLPAMESPLQSYNSLSEYSMNTSSCNEEEFCTDKLSNSGETDDSKNDRVNRVVNEMLSTEESYIREIHEIIQGYMIPLSEYSKDVPLGLFGNICEIYKFNSMLLENLKTCGGSLEGICRFFIEKSNSFLLYSSYCHNYPKSVEAIKLCMKDGRVTEYLGVLQAKLNHKLNLASYLLKPVQRISKYHLFFQNILRTCDDGDEEVVRMALSTMAEVLKQINKTQQDSYLFESFQKDVKKMRPADMGDLLIKEKLVTPGLCSQKNYLQIFLFSKAVLIAQKKNRNKSLVKVVFKAREATIIEDVSHPLVFFLVSASEPHLPFKFETISLEQKVRWCHQLKKVLVSDRTKDDVILVSKLRATLLESDMKTSANVNVDMKQMTKISDSSRGYMSLDETYMLFEQLQLKDILPNTIQTASPNCQLPLEVTDSGGTDKKHEVRHSVDVPKRASLPNNVSPKDMNRSEKKGSFKASSRSSFYHFGSGKKKSSGGKNFSNVDSDVGTAIASPRNANYLFTLKIPKSKDGLKGKLMLRYKEAKCKDVVLEGCSGIYRKLPENEPVNLSPGIKFPDHEESQSWEVLDFYYEDRLLNDLEDANPGCDNEEECFSIRSGGSFGCQDQVSLISTNQTSFISGPA